MKRSWKINLQKPLNERDLIDFFNLIAALHNQKRKPNANGLNAALKGHRQTWKNSLKTQN